MKQKSKVILLTAGRAAPMILAGGFLAAQVWSQDTVSDTASQDVQVQTAEPEVSVEQPDPEVSVVQPTPEVNVQQAEPEVVVKDAQPQVDVNQADPKINIVESEPQVNIVEKDKVEKDKAAQSEQQRKQQTAQAPLPRTENDTQNNALMQMEVTRVQGMSVQNQTGEELGAVKDVVVDRETGNAGLVISVGGFWGFGGTEVFVPADDVAVQNDILVWQTSLSEEGVKEQAQYDEQNYVSVID